MKGHLFMIANTYSDKGYNFCIVTEDDEWTLNYNHKREDAMYLHEVDIQMPKVSKLVEFGMKHVDHLKTELLQTTQEAKERIKDYQSKFILLDAPEAEELS